MAPSAEPVCCGSTLRPTAIRCSRSSLPHRSCGQGRRGRGRRSRFRTMSGSWLRRGCGDYPSRHGRRSCSRRRHRIRPWGCYDRRCVPRRNRCLRGSPVPRTKKWSRSRAKRCGSSIRCLLRRFTRLLRPTSVEMLTGVLLRWLRTRSSVRGIWRWLPSCRTARSRRPLPRPRVMSADAARPMPRPSSPSWRFV